MEYQGAVRGKKLAFKSTSKERSSKKKSTDMARQKHKRKHGASEKNREDEEEARGWVPVESESDLEGPLAIYYNHEEQLHILSLPLNVETQTLADASVQPPGLYVVGKGVGLAEAEPLAVEQVFVGRRSVPVTDSTDKQGNMYSFKSCRGTYLSVTKHGKICCTSVAIGPLEMWTPVLLPEKGDGAVALRIHQPSSPDNDYYLSTSASSITDREQSMSLAATQTRHIHVHARATSIGVNEVFTIKCQAALRRKRRKGSTGTLL